MTKMVIYRDEIARYFFGFNAVILITLEFFFVSIYEEQWMECK